VGHQGSVVLVETDKAVARINHSKVRRDKDIWHDAVLPSDLEQPQPIEGQQSPPSRTSVPRTSPLPPRSGSSSDAGDYWRDDKYAWTRVHVVPRLALYTPDSPPRSPTEDQTQPRRITIVVCKDNTRQRIEDDWKETGSVKVENQWTGETSS
jgi:hypothetical protein